MFREDQENSKNLYKIVAFEISSFWYCIYLNTSLIWWRHHEKRRKFHFSFCFYSVSGKKNCRVTSCAFNSVFPACSEPGLCARSMRCSHTTLSVFSLTLISVGCKLTNTEPCNANCNVSPLIHLSIKGVTSQNTLQSNGPHRLTCYKLEKNFPVSKYLQSVCFHELPNTFFFTTVSIYFHINKDTLHLLSKLLFTPPCERMVF